MNEKVKQLKIAVLTTGVIKCPASFLAVRLMPQKVMAWGMRFVIHGGGQKMAGKGNSFPIK